MALALETLATLVFLVACGLSSAAVTTSITTNAPTATPPPTPTSSPQPTPIPRDPVAWGEEIYQETQGASASQVCHGKTALLIGDALGRVPDMLFLTMEVKEVEAVAAYLATPDNVDGI